MISYKFLQRVFPLSAIFFAAVFILAISFPSFASPGEDDSADIREYTFVNKTGKQANVAVGTGEYAKGWYRIPAGESKTIFVEFQKHSQFPGYLVIVGGEVLQGASGIMGDRGYYAHPQKDFECFYGDQGIYGQMGGEKYDLAKSNKVPKGGKWFSFMPIEYNVQKGEFILE